MSSSVNSRRGIWLTVAACVALVILVVISFVHKMTSPRLMSDSELRANGAYLFERPRSLSNFSLIDDKGDSFTQKDLQGHWSLLFFGFTFCPDVCPTTMTTLRQFYQQVESTAYGKDLQVVMVSVDPARDTPAQLHQYVQYFHPSFSALTGDFLELHRFATQLNVPFSKVPGGGDNYTVEHGANVVLINPKGHYVGFFKAPIELAKFKATYQSIRLSLD